MRELMAFLSKIKYGVARTIWRVIKPITAGSRILLIKDNKVVLVKHTYQKELYLPGGGVKRGETFEQAIRRELMEELGGQLSVIKFFGVYNNFL
jgi:8-oxo-dGTP pyrophosphatase MutT (NUDIX family)